MHKRIILSLLVAAFNGLVYGQLTENSPYSRYALGSLKDNHFAHLEALGNPVAAFSDSALMNSSNPASWPYVSQRFPVTDFNIDGTNKILKTLSLTDRSRVLGIRHFGISVPVTRKLGFGVGLAPYSRIGYTMRDGQTIDGIGGVTYTFQGMGDINKAYLGGGATIIKRKRIEWSFGLSGYFLFGTYSHQRRADFDDATMFSTVLVSNTQVGDFSATAGTLFRFKFADHFRLQLGATFEPGMKINANRDEIGMNMRKTGPNLSPRDTAYYIAPIKGYLDAPDVINAGFLVDWKSPDDPDKNPLKRARRLTIAFNFKTASWASYAEVFNDSARTFDYLSNSMGISGGLQFIPNDMRRPDESIRFYEKFSYRLGFSHYTDYLKLRETPLIDLGISFGIGIPMLFSGTRGSINMAATLGTRGTTENALIKEQYLHYKLGLTFTPGFDYWYRKRKID